MRKHKDNFVGLHLGKITITRLITAGGNGQHAEYEYSCDCGSVGHLRSSHIRKEISDPNPERSCGKCISFIVGSPAAGKALYNTWLAMIVRCYRIEEDNPNYSHYRGRGIRVCKRWYRDPLSFVRWAVANGYTKGLEIDRIDNDSGYRPSNCRFVSRKKNLRNRRITVYVEYKGRTRVFSELVEKYAVVAYSTVFQRHFDMGWDIHSALATPARKGNYR